MLPEKYRNCKVWSVTTEGDCEGRTVNRLGTYYGNLEDIAFALADKCCYSLQFSPAEEMPRNNKTLRDKVDITLDIDSQTWGEAAEVRAKKVAGIITNPDITVIPGNYYASVTLVRSPKSLREAVLAKLTPEERKILGV